jgi:peptidoglycan/LPS O-acetylase OafA/YrhL
MQSQSPAPTRIEYIDGLRGLAVAMVVLFHSAIWAQVPRDGLFFRTLSLGRPGVDIFLVLSGFCLFYPLVKRGGPVLKLQAGDYLWRRVRRIVPPYYVAMLVVMVTSWWAHRMLAEGSPPLQSLFPATLSGFMGDTLMHLLLLHGFSNHTAHSYDGAFWSISLEWQFYLWFILLAAIARRSVRMAIALTIALTVAYRVAFAIADPEFLKTFVGNENSIGRLVAFGAGMAAAHFLAPNNSLRRANGPAALVLCMITLTVAMVYEYQSEGIGAFLPLAWAAFGGTLIVIAGTSTPLRAMLESKPLQFLGRISYSIYLFHGSAMMALTVCIMNAGLGGTAAQQVGMMLIAPPLSVLVGYGFYRLVESHFLPPSLAHRAHPQPPMLGNPASQ